MKAKKVKAKDAESTAEAVAKPNTLDTLLEMKNQQYGVRSVSKGSMWAEDPLRIPTGIFAVDYASGGGLPLWQSVCFWGPDCLAGDSEISCSTWSKLTGRRQSNKKTTVKRLYENFHNLSGKGKGHYVRKETLTSDYTVAAINSELGVLQNLVLDVLYVGLKVSFKVTTKKGYSVISSKDHRYLTELRGFRRLEDIRPGERVYIHNNTRYCGRELEKKRPTVMVKYHPFWKKKKVGKYVYYRGRVSRATVEAVFNSMSYKEYIKLLNTGDTALIERLRFLPRDLQVHHKDGDPTNNAPGNLEVLDSIAHGRMHALERHNDFRFMVVPDEIISIEDVGERESYDIVCKYPNNNFIANGIVVHNSGGKTTAAMSALSMSQRICWRCFNLLEFCTCSEPSLEMRAFWADTENTFNKGWAQAVGADPDKYYLGLADYGEQYINLAEAALRADDCGLLVVDSLANLVPSSEFEAPSEDQFIGNQAKLITRAVRRLKQRAIREMKRGHPCAIVFTNQMRHKVGVQFGDPEIMPGGFGMKHEFSLLFRCVRKSMSGDSDKKKYVDSQRKVNMAQRHSFAIRKEKVFTLAGVGEFVRIRENMPELGLRKGMVDDYNTVMNYAKEYGVVFKEKGKWRLFDVKARTLDAIQTYWKMNPIQYLRAQREIIRNVKKRMEK